MILCACCSGKVYEKCCQIYINGDSQPATAEQLMRSRYTAYATCEVQYIINTTHPSTRGEYNSKAIKEWATSSVWVKLEIISITKGFSTDTVGYVEFKAYYLDSKGQNCLHHEYSTFWRLDVNWFFVGGEIY